MKKQICYTLSLLLLVTTLAGCGGKETTTSSATTANGTTVEMDEPIVIGESGLTFSLPAEWLTNTDVNLFPDCFISADGDIFTQAKYNFVPEENFDELDDPDSDIPIADLMLPLFNILVIQEALADNATFVSESAQYDTIIELDGQEGYLYYFLTDYNGDTSDYSNDALDVYDELLNNVSAVADSVITAPPSVEALAPTEEFDNDYIAFISTTLEGENIDSSMFFGYDLTVVNFWGSYAYPDINELDELQAYYETLQAELPNVNFVQVIIDTPDEAAEEIVKAAYAEHGVTFTGISPDATLGKWVMNNLAGLPTTIFVDNTCKIVDFKLEGAKDASYYMESTKEVLEALQAE